MPGQPTTPAPGGAAVFGRRMAMGALMGLGAIVPGISTGVFMVSMGIYEVFLDAVNTFLRTPKRNFLFLLPFGIGGGLAILALSNLMSLLMARWESPIIFLFLGMVAGGVPGMLRKANQGGLRPGYLLAGALGVVAMLVLGGPDTQVPLQAGQGALGWPAGLLSGAVLAFGSIVPGVSTTFILLRLGLYQATLGAIGSLDIVSLIPVGIGGAVTALALIRLVGYLFKRFAAHSQYAALGLLIGSMAMIVPPLQWDLTLAINLLLLGVGIGIALLLARYEGEARSL